MDWAVVMTASNAERKVLRGMAPFGLLPYLPLYLDARGRSRCLFRNYIFVQYMRDIFHHCFSIPGVARVLMMNDNPLLVRDTDVERIRARETDNGFVDLPRAPKARFTAGQKIEVVRGPLKGRIGIYKGMSHKQREQVLFMLLNRECVIDFGYGDLAAA